MRKIELEITGLRKLPIVIGAFEAQAIAVAIEKLNINRPLSHDLIKNILGAFEIQLKEIIIDNLQDGIFFAKLICEKDGQEIDIDSRTSDALALAVRFECPIYTYEFILESAGTILTDESKDDDDDEASDLDELAEELSAVASKDELSQVSTEDLKAKLEEALASEDYEKAARIRDEIERREA
jgi:uncharacterized protein